MGDEARCQSCGAPIKWVLNVATGARLPLVATPISGMRRELLKPGMAVVAPNGHSARLLTLEDIDAGGEKREKIDGAIAEARIYVTHFADCPASARHSGVGRRQTALDL